jgi:uncharacterized membrane protein
MARLVSKEDIRFHIERKQDLRSVMSLVGMRLDRDDRIFVHFPGSAKYTPVSYLPQAAGIALGRVVGGSPVVLSYFGRGANLFVWLLLTFLAVRATPVAKWLFVLLALTPMALFQAASLSADAMTNGLAFLFIAMCLKYSVQEPQTVRRREWAIVWTLGAILSLAKFAYVTLLILWLLIPAREERARYWLGCLLVGSGVLIAVYLWFAGQTDQTLGRVAHAGLERLMGAPFSTLEALGTQLFLNAPLYAEQLIGRLGWADTQLSDLHWISYLSTLLLVSVAGETGEGKLSASNKQVLLVALVAGCLLIAMLFASVSIETGTPIAYGIQGRYFLPLAPLFFLLLQNRRVLLLAKLWGPAVSGYAFLSGWLSLLRLFRRFWG